MNRKTKAGSANLIMSCLEFSVTPQSFILSAMKLINTDSSRFKWQVMTVNYVSLFNSYLFGFITNCIFSAPCLFADLCLLTRTVTYWLLLG